MVGYPMATRPLKRDAMGQQTNAAVTQEDTMDAMRPLRFETIKAEQAHRLARLEQRHHATAAHHAVSAHRAHGHSQSVEPSLANARVSLRFALAAGASLIAVVAVALVAA